jgi:hypothetical protein
MSHPDLAFAVQLAQLVTYVFGAITVVIACLGLSAWRRQLVGTRRIQLAEKALGLFYKARDRFTWFRARGIFSNELEEVARLDGETDGQFEARKSVAVGLKRFYKGADVFSEIESLQYEFAAVFGVDALTAFSKMKSATSAFLAAGHTLIEVKRQIAEYPGGPIHAPRNLADDAQALSAQFWGADKGTDDVAKDLHEAIERIESTCKPILQPPRFGARALAILSRVRRRVS